MPGSTDRPTRSRRRARRVRLESFGRPEPRPGSTRTARVDWIDAARGLAIVAVVLLHVSIGHYYGLPHAEKWVLPRWDRINQVVAVVRMPLLFVVSGMLAAGKIRRGFTHGNAILSAVTNYYLYVVWLVVYGILFLLSGPIAVPFEPARWQDYAIQIVEPRTPLWFVFALAVYMILFTALRNAPRWLILTVFSVVSVWGAMIWTVESPLWTRAILYVVYFAIGALAKDLIIARARTWWILPVSAAAAYVLYKLITLRTLMTPEPLSLRDAVVLSLLQLAASVAAITASAQLCRLRPWRQIGTWVGRRTLGIYVMHVPVIVAVELAVRLGPLAGLGHLTSGFLWFDLTYPLLMTAFVIAACVWLEALLGAMRLGHLFRMPSRFRRALYRRADGRRLPRD